MLPLHADPPEIEERLWDGILGYVGFDVGANVGQSYVLFMRRRFEVVYAFEPAAEAFEELRQHQVAAHNIAVSDHDGEVTFNAEERGMLSCIDPGARITVPCRTLDGLAKELAKPDFVKIDVEGHEVEVVQGGLDTLRDASFLIEIHHRSLGEAVSELLPGAEAIRHPHYREGSENWSNHYWLKRL